MWKYIVTYTAMICLLKQTDDGRKYFDCTNEHSEKRVFYSRQAADSFVDSAFIANEKHPIDSFPHFCRFQLDSIKVKK